MNWSRGLFRLWTALTLIVFVVATYGLIITWPSPTMEHVIPSPTPRGDKPLEPWEIIPAKTVWVPDPNYRMHAVRHIKEYVGWVLILPAALFVFGWGTLWIARGFTSKP